MFSFKAYCQVVEYFFCCYSYSTNQTNTRRLYFGVIVSNAHVLSNLINELRKMDRMRGSVKHLSVVVAVLMIKQKLYLSNATKFIIKLRFFREFATYMYMYTRLAEISSNG